MNDALMDLDFVVLTVEKHLAGKHDQSSHGRGGGIASAPRSESHAKQKEAWDLYQTGKTWGQIAEQLGYANSGAARNAGLAHKKRADKEKDKGGDTPPPNPTPKPTPKAEPPAGALTSDQSIALAQASFQEAMAVTGSTLTTTALREAQKGGSVRTPTDKEIEVVTKLTEAGGHVRAAVKARIDEKLTPELRQRRTTLEKRLIDDKEMLDEVKGKFDKADDAYWKVKKKHAKEVTPSVASEFGVDPKHLELHHGRVEGASRANRNINLTLSADREAMKAANDGLIPFTDEARREYRRKLIDASNKIYDIQRTERGEGGVLNDVIMKRRSAQEIVREARTDYALTSKKLREINTEATDYLNSHHATSVNQITQEVLTQVNNRTFGNKNIQFQQTNFTAPMKPAVDNLVWANRQLPDELTRNIGKVEVGAPGGRAHAERRGLGEAFIKVGDGSKSTMIHELGHVVEHTKPSVTQMEFVYHHIRAKGEKPKWLGVGYPKIEKAVHDEWREKYAGKVYGGGRTSSWEIFTTGVQSILGNDPHMRIDDGHADFTMAVLAFA